MIKKVVLATALLCGSASAIDNREMVATLINAEGYLCAEITQVRELAIRDVFEVTCIEYRGGTATVVYRIDARHDPAIITKA